MHSHLELPPSQPLSPTKMNSQHNWAFKSLGLSIQDQKLSDGSKTPTDRNKGSFFLVPVAEQSSPACVPQMGSRSYCPLRRTEIGLVTPYCSEEYRYLFSVCSVVWRRLRARHSRPPEYFSFCPAYLSHLICWPQECLFLAHMCPHMSLRWILHC